MWEDRYIFVCMTTPPPSLNSIKLREYYLTLTWVCIFKLSYYNISNTSYQYTINCKQKKHTKMCCLMLWFILHDQSGVFFAAENVDELDELIIEKKDDSKGTFCYVSVPWSIIDNIFLHMTKRQVNLLKLYHLISELIKMCKTIRTLE